MAARRSTRYTTGARTAPGATTKRSMSRWQYQLVDLSDGLGAQAVGQLGVVGGVGQVLAVAEDEVEEGLERLALRLVGLLLVGQDPGGGGDRVGGVAVGP